MLLKTKLFAPPLRHNAVARGRLLEQLGKPTPGRLTLIHAPAGYGKTTLALQWLAHLDIPGAWLSLDPQDNDPQRFWRYVSGTLAQAEGAQKVPFNTDTDPETWLISLLNHWSQDNRSTPQVLVLDDFHVIQDPALLDGVSWFLDRLPPSLHVLITSRSLPNLHIPLRRVRDTVREVRADQLSFGRTESQLFFQNTLKLAIPPNTLDALQAKTEGWAAALQLAGLSLKQQPVQALQWLERDSAHVLIDYLAEEVLANLAEDLQLFLLRMALVRRFSLPLCCHLNGDASEEDTRDLLQALQEDNLFLIPLDNRAQWFRFHELFRENLLNIVHQQWQDQLPDLYRRAADWFIRDNDKEEAIHCLLGGELWDEAADLIEELGVTRMLAGQNESLNWWLSRLPADFQMQRPKLALIKAWSLFCTERVVAAEPYLDQAEQLLAPGPKENRPLLTQIAIFRAQLARVRGEEEKARHWSEQARRLTEQKGTELNAVARFALGMELFQEGRHTSAREMLELALPAARRERNYFCVLTSSAMLAHTLFQQGKSASALQSLDEARHWLIEAGLDPYYLSCWLNIVYAYICRELNALDKSRAYIEVLKDYRDEGAEAAHGALIDIMNASLAVADGDWQTALKQLNDAEPVLEQDRSHWSSMGPSVAMVRAQFSLQSGRTEEALRWAAERETLLLRDPSFRREEERILLARCMALQHRHEEALALLQSVEADAAVHQRVMNQARAMVSRAVVLAQQGKLQSGATCLHEALILCEDTGFRRLFLDDAVPLSPLFQHLAMLGIRGWWDSIANATANLSRQSGMIEPLTAREREVLDMIASGHRNQAIADSLHIAITTTKAHIRNIYEKMAVSSRTQAVARARELGLLK